MASHVIPATWPLRVRASPWAVSVVQSSPFLSILLLNTLTLVIAVFLIDYRHTARMQRMEFAHKCAPCAGVAAVAHGAAATALNNPTVSLMLAGFCNLSDRGIPSPLMKISPHRRAIMNRGGATPAVIDIGLYDALVRAACLRFEPQSAVAAPRRRCYHWLLTCAFSLHLAQTCFAPHSPLR